MILRGDLTDHVIGSSRAIVWRLAGFYPLLVVPPGPTILCVTLGITRLRLPFK